MTAGKDGSGGAHDLVRACQDLSQHLGRQLLRERRNGEGEQRHASHREHIVERVRRSDRPECPWVVDDGWEEVDRKDDCTLVVEAVDGCIVGGIEPHDQVDGIDRDKAGEQLFEPYRRVLGGAPAGLRE